MKSSQNMLKNYVLKHIFSSSAIVKCIVKIKKAVRMHCLFRWLRGFYAFFTFSTTAAKAAGLLRARSARTLRFISMPLLWMRPMSLE